MVLQHVAHEPLGTLDPMLKAAGFRIRYINFGRDPQIEPELDAYSGLIVLGGPMAVYEADKYTHLKTEMRLIEQALQKNIPVLGICLGAQLVAAVLGAQVRKARDWELGWYDVHVTEKAKSNPLFKAYDKSEKIFQLHQDTFDVPQSADHLAWTTMCEGQAFAYGDKVYGLQFHLEVDEAMILRWLDRPEHKKIIEASAGVFSEDQLRAETHQFIQRSLELSRATFGQFIQIFQLPEKKILLGSEHGREPKKRNSK